MITTISLVTICPLQNSYNIITHIPHAVYYIPVAYLFYNQRLVHLIHTQSFPFWKLYICFMDL